MRGRGSVYDFDDDLYEEDEHEENEDEEEDDDDEEEEDIDDLDDEDEDDVDVDDDINDFEDQNIFADDHPSLSIAHSGRIERSISGRVGAAKTVLTSAAVSSNGSEGRNSSVHNHHRGGGGDMPSSSSSSSANDAPRLSSTHNQKRILADMRAKAEEEAAAAEALGVKTFARAFLDRATLSIDLSDVNFTQVQLDAIGIQVRSADLQPRLPTAEARSENVTRSFRVSSVALTANGQLSGTVLFRRISAMTVGDYAKIRDLCVGARLASLRQQQHLALRAQRLRREAALQSLRQQLQVAQARVEQKEMQQRSKQHQQQKQQQVQQEQQSTHNHYAQSSDMPSLPSIEATHVQLLRAQEQLQQAASVVSGSIGSYNTASESGDLAAACVALAALAPCLGYSAVEVGSVELDLRNSFGGNSLLGEGSLIDLGAKWGEVAISPRTILSGETEAEIAAAERAIEKDEDSDDVVTTVAGIAAESPSSPPITTSSNQQGSNSSELNNLSSARVNETPKKKASSTSSSGAGVVDSQQGVSQPSSSSIPTPTLLDLVPLSSRLRVRIGGASLGLSEHAAPFFAKFVSDVALTAVEEWTDAVREISAERIKRRQIMHSAQQQALRKQQQQQQLLQQQLGSTTSQRFEFNDDFTGGTSGGIGLPRFQQQALFTSSLHQSSLNNNRPSSSNSPFVVPHVQQPWGSGRRDEIGSSIFSYGPSSSTPSLREMNDNDGQRLTSGETSVGAVVLVDGKERGVSQELSNMAWGRLDIIVEKTLYLRLITDSTAVEASVSGVRLSLEQAPLLFEGSSTLEVLEDKGGGNIVVAGGGDIRGGAETLINSNAAFPENVDNQVYDRAVNDKTNRGAIGRGGGGGDGRGLSSSSSSARWAAAFSGPRSSGGISAGDLEMVHRTLSLSLTSATVAKIAFDASSSSSSSSSSSLVSNTVKQSASSSAAIGGTSRSSSSSLNRGVQGISSAAPQQSSWPSRGVVSSSSLSSSSSSSSSSSLLSDVPASGGNARNSLPIVSLPPFELELDTEQWVDVSDYVISLEERVFYLLNSSFLPRLSPASNTASSSSSVSSASAILSAGGSGSITNAAVSSSSSSTGPATGSKSIEIAFNPKEFEPLTGQRGVLKAFAASFVEAQKAFKSDATQVYQLLEAAEQAAQALYQQQRSIEVGAGGGGGGGGVNPQFHPHRSHPHGNRGEAPRSSLGPSSQSIVTLVFEPNESKAADLGRSSCLVFAPTFVNLFGTTISDWDFLLRRITGIASADQGIKMIPRHLHESVTLPLAMLLGMSRDVTIIAAPLLLSCANAAIHIPFPLPPTQPDTVFLLTGNNQESKAVVTSTSTQQQEGKVVTSTKMKL